MGRAVASLETYLRRPVDIASLAVFRIAFGVMMMVVTLRYLSHGWVSEYFIVPKHFFHYYGFEWVRPWPGEWMIAHFVIMLAAAACVALGVFYRPAIWAFLALFAYQHLIDKTNYLNHYFQVCWLSLLLAFLPADRAFSMRVWRKPEDAVGHVPQWMVSAIRFQVGVVYFFGGVAKLNADWLFHAQPLTIWLGANREFPLIGSLFSAKWMAYAFSWAGALFDLTIWFWLSRKRTRPAAYAAVIFFHVVTARLFQIGMFPWVMIAATPIFFEPNWPRAFFGRWLPRVRRVPPNTLSKSVIDSAPGRVMMVGYIALQVLMPLRHWLYPGNRLWTEEGFRFAWNVMLIEKGGSASFDVVEQSTGKKWTVEPYEFMTRYQAKMMSTQPDMILEAAHQLKRDFSEKGHPEVQIHAHVQVGLNGRRPAALVDPSVDLANEVEGFRPKRWILPAPTEAPEL